MSLLLSCSFASETVTEKAYFQLHKTMKTNPSEVWVWDNHYPTNREGFVRDICMKYGFIYMHSGENIGLYAAYRRLIGHIHEFKRYEETVLFYDGDGNPQQDDWHLALEQVLTGNTRVVHSTLLNQTINRELRERGFDFETINGIKCMVPHTACTNTICGFNLRWLERVGGLTGKYFYGGNEIAMWPEYSAIERWVFLQDFIEDSVSMRDLHDWQYHQYKLLYAHKGMDMSFADYLKTNPSRIYDLEKTIFG